MVSPGSVCFNLNWDSPCGIYAVKPNICFADTHVEQSKMSARPQFTDEQQAAKMPLQTKL